MSDPNPYEAPQSNERTPLKKIVKRGLGAATLALLTIPAVVITGAISCGVSVDYYDDAVSTKQPGDPLLIGLLIWLIPPALVFAVMFYFIIRARRRQRPS